METKVCTKCKEEKNVCNFYYRQDWEKYISICKLCDSKVRKEQYLLNQDTKKNYSKKYYYLNRETKLQYGKNYYSQNKDDKKKYDEKYRVFYKNIRSENNKNNRDSINEKDRYRRANDPMYNIARSVRSRLRRFLKSKNVTKKNKTFDIVGCTPQFLKEYLQIQFTDGMSWDNRSEWHIDHIIPLSSVKTEDELYKLCHYKNLQPLWAEDNLKKSNKIL